MKTDNLNKREATEALVAGHRLRHEYYSDSEWVELQNSGQLVTEDGYPKGTCNGEWWKDIQKWDWGWEIVKQKSLSPY